MSDYFLFLPGDVLIDILARLPLKTLVRCTSVCKSWYSLLTNPSFITKHLNLNRSPSNNYNELLLVRSYTSRDDGDEQEHYSLRFDDNGMFLEYQELDLPLKSYCNHYFRIIGSCNGLICLSDDQFMYIPGIFLWNPSIRKVLPLNPLPITFKSHGPYTHTIGFGFDSITDDYKVVRIVRLQFVRKSEIDIFSLSTGTWRNISHVALPHITIDEKAPQAYLNGAAHWIASSLRGHRGLIGHGSLIVSFHMGHEEFGEIMLSNRIMVHSNYLMMPNYPYFRVDKFQESLAVILFSGCSEDNTCRVWVMKEYGVTESWTQQFNIDMTQTFNTLAGFTRKGELLLATSDGYLVAHDPQAGRSTHLFIRGTTHSIYRYSFYADAYTESLVLLGNRFCDTGTSEES
ncbi:F-box/kelch-repeat protein At3g06240-like [Cornus florida]|uniref:F-box/kelch-repeat protein At3g06240-like n=1 Tax=Cornus florida TaxID=4283 RepID=UPI002899737F|nr:F-box/kelch-repeat protein At3g06240-like [Cornus florida]